MGEHDSDDEAIEGERLGEDHHKNQGNKDISLGVSTDTGVTNDTNAKASSQVGETAAKASAELLVTSVVVVAPSGRGAEGRGVIFDLSD